MSLALLRRRRDVRTPVAVMFFQVRDGPVRHVLRPVFFDPGYRELASVAVPDPPERTFLVDRLLVVHAALAVKLECLTDKRELALALPVLPAAARRARLGCRHLFALAHLAVARVVLLGLEQQRRPLEVVLTRARIVEELLEVARLVRLDIEERVALYADASRKVTLVLVAVPIECLRSDPLEDARAAALDARHVCELARSIVVDVAVATTLMVGTTVRGDHLSRLVLVSVRAFPHALLPEHDRSLDDPGVAPGPVRIEVRRVARHERLAEVVDQLQGLNEAGRVPEHPRRVRVHDRRAIENSLQYQHEPVVRCDLLLDVVRDVVVEDVVSVEESVAWRATLRLSG